jgi:hypothetical protein
MATTDGVLITVGHQLARVTPSTAAGLLADELACTATQYSAGGPLGYQRQTRRLLLVRPDDEGGLLVPTGLVDVVRRRLIQAGFQVRVDDRRCFEARLTPCQEALDAAHPADRGLLRAVVQEPRMLIEAGGRTDLVRKMALICKLFPQARVLLALNAGRRQLRALRRSLRDAGAPFHGVADYPWSFEGGRLAASLADFDLHNGVDFDLVLFADALQALGPAHDEAFVRLGHQRVYGFVAPGLPLSAGSRLRLLERFGPFVYPAPDPRGAEAAVSVYWLEPSWVSPVGDVGALQRKRRAFWHNGLRNDDIAAVARALRDRDDRFVAERGLLLAEDDCTSYPGRAGRTVAVLVESTQHGRELLRRLPGWALRDAVPVPPGCRPRLLDPLEWGLFDQTIITYAVAARERVLDVDVLVCAGPEWPPALAGFLPRSLRPGRRVLLVDLADDVDGAARAAVRRRLRDHAARGWASRGAPRWALGDDQDTRKERPRGRARAGRG